ncbi:MAG: ABC transporter permease [Muribaculaceae bacterium]|nr:ABC transporter permease [Muribaculaceae bacterium]
MLDLFREIGQTLRNNRLRTALTGFSVAWGIFMLIVLLGAARGVRNAFEERSSAETTNLISFWGGRTTIPYKGYKDGRFISLKNGDMEGLKHDNPGIVADAGAEVNMNHVISSNRESVSTGFTAVFPRAAALDRVEMLYGRFVNNRDIDNNRRVMVLHENNAKQLFGKSEDALGKTVRCMDLGWTVVGVYGGQRGRTNYMPYTTYKVLSGNDDYVSELQVHLEGLRTEADGEAAEEALRATLARRHEFSPEDKSALWTWNRFTSSIRVGKSQNYLTIAVWVIGILTLLSGIVGVSNIMFVSVRERTHEIGIRRAIGARPRSILTQVIAESIAVTSLFGYAGIVAGMALLQLLDMAIGNSDDFRHPTVDISIALQVMIALVIAGTLAGLFPALKAIKVKPVEALRDE